jgi:hypothetical protein
VWCELGWGRGGGLSGGGEGLVEEVWDTQPKWLHMDREGGAGGLFNGPWNKGHVTSKLTWKSG